MTKVLGRSRSALSGATGLVRRPRLWVLALLGVLAMPGLADAAAR